jgi:hypothetical protein
MSTERSLTPGDKFPLGQRVALPGHFLEPVTLEAVRFIGSGYECRVRLGDGTPDEAIISLDEAAALTGQVLTAQTAIRPADAEKLRLLVESVSIRLAYAHDRQFAVSLSGIRTLPHQIEAVYMKMLPQPRLRFLLADDPGAGKTIMAGLLLKEMKLREANRNSRTRVLAQHRSNHHRNGLACVQGTPSDEERASGLHQQNCLDT